MCYECCKTKSYWICDDCCKEAGGTLGVGEVWYVYENCDVCHEMKRVSQSVKWNNLNVGEKAGIHYAPMD